MSKALAFQEPYATLITLGYKTAECRTKKVSPMKDLIVCASKTAKLYYPIPGLVYGYAIGLVDIVDCVPFTEEHLDVAMMSKMPDKESYAWILDNATMIDPFEVKASIGFFNVDQDPKIIKSTRENYINKYLPLAYKLKDPAENEEALDVNLGVLLDYPEYLMESFDL